MKKIFTISIILFILTGCAKFGKINDNPIVSEFNKDFDIMDYISELKEGTEVSYDLDFDNSKIFVYLFNNNKKQTIKRNIEVLDPLGKIINKDKEIDVYKGFDINEFIEKNEDASILDYELNYKKSELLVTLTNGERNSYLQEKMKIIEPLAEIINNNPSIDLYEGVDIDSIVKVNDKSASLDYECDIENQLLHITLTKDDRIETYDLNSEIYNSNPLFSKGEETAIWKSYALDFRGAVIPTYHDNWFINTYYFNSDGTGKEYNSYYKKYSYFTYDKEKIYMDYIDNDNGQLCHCAGIYWFEGDSLVVDPDSINCTVYFLHKVTQN